MLLAVFLVRDDGILTLGDLTLTALFGGRRPPFVGAQLFLALYIGQYTAVLCAAFTSCVVRFGCVGRVAALVHAVAGQPITPQSVDILNIWRVDCIELRQHVLRGSTLEKQRHL